MATITEKEIREMADEWGQFTTEIETSSDKAAELKKKIFAWLKKTNRLMTITGKLAIAKRFEKFGDREITLTDFLEAAADKTEEERNACLKVGIKEAEELLGKAKVNEISNRSTVPSNGLELIEEK